MVMSYGRVFVLDKNSGQAADDAAQDAPALQTAVVHHDECTECGDFELDSGAVIIPLKLRSQYIQKNASWSAHFRGADSNGWGSAARKVDSADSLKSIKNQSDKLRFMRYRLYTVKLVNEAAFDSLFLLPGRTRDDTIRNSAGNIYPWDFNRRYRVMFGVIGMDGRYLMVRVRKAVRLPDR